MTSFLILVLFLLLALGWCLLRDQVQDLDSRLRWSAKQDRTEWEQQIAALTERVRNLEQQLAPLSKPSAVPAALSDEPVTVDPSPQPWAKRRSALASEPIRAQVSEKSAAHLAARPESTLAAPRHDESHQFQKLLERGEWETLIAGNLLNKLGALILVIGIALFLGYSFTLVSPEGRSALATFVSVSLLLSGVFLERRPHYRMFSRGLLGAGWAALYTTAYAMYALPAAQIISNPWAGSLLLLSVSAGMIAHSLRYRAQAVTSIAFFSAFAALAVTPSTPFAVASLIPLSASLLYFAWRFEWYPMAFFGLAATYGTCFSRGDGNAPLYLTTSILLTDWALFEFFDIVRSWRGVRSAGTTWIFPVNAMTFLALLERAWAVHAPQDLWQMAAGAALLFVFSALARPPRPSVTGKTAPGDPFDSIRTGTYEAPLTIAAILAGLAILGHVTGFWTNVALACEAELLYFAGLRWKLRFLRGLGRCGFLASLGNVVSTSFSHPDTMTILGHSLHHRTPSLIVHVSLFYLNRVLFKAVSDLSFAATGLTALIIVSELAPRTASLALFLFALVLFEIGLQKQRKEFRLQSYLVAAAAMVPVLRAGGWESHPSFSVYGYFGAYALVSWLFTARTFLIGEDEVTESERTGVRDVSAICGSGFALAFLWMLLPGALTTVAWTGLGLVWLTRAFVWNVMSFRWLAAGVVGMGYARLLAFNLSGSWAAQTGVEHWLIPLFAIGALYYVWHVFRRVPEEKQRSFAPVFTWLAAIAAVWLLNVGIHQLYLAGAWALLGLAFLVTGLRLFESAFRWQSYGAMTLAVVSCVLINWTEADGKEMFARIGGAALVVGCLFAMEFLLPRNTDSLGALERYVRRAASLAAVLVLTGLLYHEVSGGWLTVAWGLEGSACLGVGFPAREKTLRWHGLAVFGLCILKLFFYDLRNLETVYRIGSFLALGAILLGVSLIYTRFRNQIQRFL